MKKRTEVAGAEIVSPRYETRVRILSVAMKLLNAGGRDAVTTRAVAQGAGVQPPVLYRLFGDKEALLNALAEHGFTLYLAQKQPEQSDQDPVEALRSGWDKHIQFSLKHPSLYLLMYAQPQPAPASAAELSFAMLHRHIARVAAAGRLRVPQERAVALFHAAALGIALTLLRSHPRARDLELSSVARDYMLSMIAMTNDALIEQSPISTAARTLDAAISMQDGFSQGEYGLFKEWLGRIKAIE